ncbi:MAG: 1-deoxy-D-xylulose-5-phosphate reductoisomerase, partial [Bifidobacteriaceae bacterium]|nr:1-deoxy-D-xylulose-5-phosphate reductoisomerase [Bifidobacteriaceae bacterium]
MRKRLVALLGSTGSIGTQALQVIAAHRDRFQVCALAAGSGHPRLLASQIAALRPTEVAVPTDDAARAVMAGLAALGISHGDTPRITAGPSAAAQVAGGGADVVLN